LFGDAGNNESAKGVAAQDNVVQPFPFDHVHHVGDVGIQVDTGAQQM